MLGTARVAKPEQESFIEGDSFNSMNYAFPNPANANQPTFSLNFIWSEAILWITQLGQPALSLILAPPHTFKELHTFGSETSI